MLHITQFGREVADGWICGITLDQRHSFDSCAWDGKVDHSMAFISKKIVPWGPGVIAQKYCYESPKLQDGDNYIWLPLMDEETELAFTGKTLLVDDVLYGKIYWE